MKFSLGKNGFLFRLFFVKTIVLFEVHVVSSSDQTIILLSYDGFRYDYLDKYKEALPTLRKIASDGVRADYVQNVYPTETFPNHYTLVTGLYPESHGIVANNMYDPAFNASFTMKTNDSRWWQAGEPIWVTSEKVGHKTGVCYWPGYDAVIRGYQPSYRPMNTSYGRPYLDENIMPWKDRIDMAVGWLNQTNPPKIVLLYFNDPDEEGHKFGTDSKEVKTVLEKLDWITSYLLEQLKLLDSFDKINLIFTSDHGMMNFYTSNLTSIDEYIDADSMVMWTYGMTRLHVTNSSKSSLEDLYQQFKKAESATGAFNVYKKEEVPEYFHYRHNRRIPDIIAVAKPPHLFNLTKIAHYTGNFTLVRNHTYGVHGLNPLLPKMHPYFVAYGPAFKRGHRSGRIDCVDLYPLMCHILGIKPAPNNGSLDRISHILKHSNWFMTTLKSNMTIVLVVVCSLLGLFFLTIFVIIVKRCKRKDGLGSVHFTNRRKEHFEKPLMESDDEEDEIVIM